MAVSGFSWATIEEPEQILGHHRPTTFDELLNSKREVWRTLYRNWLWSRGANEEVVDAFGWLCEGLPSDDWHRYFTLEGSFSYRQFYEEVGDLKAVLRNPPPDPFAGIDFGDLWGDPEWRRRFDKWARSMDMGESLDFMYAMENQEKYPDVKSYWMEFKV